MWISAPRPRPPGPSNRFRLSLGVQIVLPGSHDRLPGLERDVVVGVAGSLGWAFTDRWGALLELDWRQSPFRDAGVVTLDGCALEITIGLRWAPEGPWAFELGFVEDLANGASTDYTILAATAFRFP